MRFRSAIGLALLFVCGVAPAGASAAGGAETLHWDPAIRRGVLANGLRYVVMRNATPAGGTSMRLGVDVGSLEEADDERGAAHFVEHLAFGETHAMAGVDLEAAFNAAGVAFGRDRNAETTVYSTVYRIDLPGAGEKAQALAFQWLRTVADGAVITDEAVNRERGVILAERESDLTAAESARRAISVFEGQGLRAVDREPIGEPASLRAMTAARLRGFYTRWYRPENAVVVVVGDQPAEALERRVAEVFGSWKADGPAPAGANRGLVDTARGLTVLVRSEPTLPTEVSVCRARPAPTPRGADDVARLRLETTTGLWAEILQARLARAAQGPGSAIVSAQVTHDLGIREMAGACVSIVPASNDWQGGLAAIETEVRRLAETDPTETELEVAIKAARSRYRGAALETQTRRSPGLASDMVATALLGDVTPSPGEAFRAFDAAVADLTPSDLRKAFARDWSGAGPLIAVISPTAPAKAAVEATWTKVAAAALPAAPPAGADEAAWAYGDFGPPGRITRRETFTGPNFARITFANGVVLNVMHTDFEQNAVKLSVVFGAGRREIANGDQFTAQIAALLFKQGGLGRHDFARIKALYGEEPGDAELAIGSDAFQLDGSSSGRGVDSELQLLAAYASDPGFRDLDPTLATFVDYLYRLHRTIPALVVDEALDEAISPGGPMNLPPQERLSRLRTADLKRVLKPALTQSPLVVTIVGDVDEQEATRYVAATFGALPARPESKREKPDTWFLRFPDHPVAPILVTHDGPAEKAMIALVWPLYVARVERRREEYALDLLADILTNRLRHRLRDELGGTYDPQAYTRMPDLADQGYLEAVVETAPADVETERAEIGRVAAQVAQGDFTDAELEAVRGPKLAKLAASGRTNEWWLAGLSASARSDYAMTDLAAMQGLYASISTAEVRKAAAQWLSRAPIVVVARPKAVPPAGPAAP